VTQRYAPLPALQYEAIEEAAQALRVERGSVPGGLWLGKVITPVWNTGQTYGVGFVLSEALDISAGSAFLTNAPPVGRRWCCVAFHRTVTVAATRFLLEPKDEADAAMRLSTDATAETSLVLGWPGIIVENRRPFGGGRIGLDQGDGADVAITMQVLGYETVIS